jgi:hypothetical protein
MKTMKIHLVIIAVLALGGCTTYKSGLRSDSAPGTVTFNHKTENANYILRFGSFAEGEGPFFYSEINDFVKFGSFYKGTYSIQGGTLDIKLTAGLHRSMVGNMMLSTKYDWTKVKTGYLPLRYEVVRNDGIRFMPAELPDSKAPRQEINQDLMLVSLSAESKKPAAEHSDPKETAFRTRVEELAQAATSGSFPTQNDWQWIWTELRTYRSRENQAAAQDLIDKTVAAGDSRLILSLEALSAGPTGIPHYVSSMILHSFETALTASETTVLQKSCLNRFSTGIEQDETWKRAQAVALNLAKQVIFDKPKGDFVFSSFYKDDKGEIHSKTHAATQWSSLEALHVYAAFAGEREVKVFLSYLETEFKKQKSQKYDSYWHNKVLKPTFSYILTPLATAGTKPDTLGAVCDHLFTYIDGSITEKQIQCTKINRYISYPVKVESMRSSDDASEIAEVVEIAELLSLYGSQQQREYATQILQRLPSSSELTAVGAVLLVKDMEKANKALSDFINKYGK